MPKRLHIYIFLIVILLSFITEEIKAEESTPSFSGSAGYELWYADWNAENQWSKQGVDLDYDIDPAFIHGYSVTLQYNKNKKPYSWLMLDYFTSKMEKESDTSVFETGNDSFKKIVACLTQRIGKNSLIHLKYLSGDYSGQVKIKQGGESLGVPDGSIWDLSTEWFLADALYLFESEDEKNSLLGGIGFRYLNYEKPETTSLFLADGPTEGLMTEGTLLEGEVVNTKFEGYYLVLGAWDKSYLGLPTDNWCFVDVLGFLGAVKMENEIIGSSTGLGGGIEGSFGFKFSYNFSRNTEITTRLGYRFLYNKMCTTDEESTDSDGNGIYTVTETIDTWHGPFIQLRGFF